MPNPKPKVYITTLGCRLNESESSGIAANFSARGYRLASSLSEADVIVVNTCTVTNKTDQESRRLIRLARRKNPAARIVATGCYAETDAERLGAMEEVDCVVSNKEKFSIAELIAGEEVSSPPWDDSIPAEKSRANIRVQQGCDDACAYCKVVLARGPSRSRPVSEVIRHVNKLVEAGFQEGILTGVQLGQYNFGGVKLSGLIQTLLEETGIARLRLSSINPDDVTEELIRTIVQSNGRAANFLHVAVQSGSDAVLRRMNRRYTGALVRERIALAAARIPRLGLGSDILVGFPGETAEDFEETRRLVEELPFTTLHVFRYSPRAGTPAARLEDNVASAEKRRRSETIRALAAQKQNALCEALVQAREPLRVLIEPERDKETQLLGGRSGNYAVVHVKGAEGRIEELVRVRPEEAISGGILGSLIE